ncbi:hypothetical protein COO60DRAFT_1698204 [Scenedesmus sp. NREL 46B-D3]|nr:hypothetical protein COO60DRAFT_1698204 [Scenedesmus sp. NREL 46B-D3]
MQSAVLRAPGASRIGTTSRSIGSSSCAASTAHICSVSRRARMQQQASAVSTAAAPAMFADCSPAGHVQQLLGLAYPPVQPLLGSEDGSFAQETITTRLPAIMDTVLADLAAEGAAAASHPQQEQLKQQLAAAAVGVKQIQQEMPVDGALQPLQLPPHLPAGHPLSSIIPTTNAAVAAWAAHSGQAASWLQLPWLTVECYLYVRLATIIASQPLLAGSQYDPFFRQKCTALSKSMAAAGDIAAALQLLLQEQQDAIAAAGCGGAPQMAAHFSEETKGRFYQLLQYSLWGNKTDLSMLVDVAHLDSSAAAAAAAVSSSSGSGNSNIIVDETDALWEYLKAKAAAAQGSGSEGLQCSLPRIDIILDNAGLELFTDLVLADYLVATGLAGQVVLHGKALPWFVSDTLTHDLDYLIQNVSSSSGGEAHAAALAAAGQRWAGHMQSGRWRFAADQFWTTPHPFWWMQELAPELHAELAASSLLVFKGDLNYRKLANDCRWPATTPFTTALGGFCPTGLLSLRTLKADVIAGLAPGEAEALDKLDPRWQVNGKFGVLQFAQP